ncbi:carboxylesterase family protein [Sphingopyxis granuli]|uniref:carboxylesterase/lipase family protein n=1 Tax=Sphingopyxis granuli TaxID=267128 RepID=UPI001F533E03|nr:carboxylesterase family protein [Sphingopyxis granuli]UNK80235.1 carboxylesterase family protein [Sphingopyxis granuli]
MLLSGRAFALVFGAPLLGALAAFAVPAAAASSRPAATVAEGRIAGSLEDGVRVFKGLPYALPPVGARRWRPPALPASWQGVREARAFGPDCVQPPYPADSVYFEPPRPTSEDCLTLNVWAPRNAARAPVIVWIHGGALQHGGSASPMYDGREYAKRGIVFVSINYRLGIFGWLAHPGLSAEAPDRVSGNYGLLDQIAALEWVKRNIAAFGGDPANVTAMGESAGALSVTYLLAAPRAKGLFGRAIVQSTNMRAVPRLRDPAYGLPSAEAIGAAFAESVGVKDPAALRAFDAETLTAAALRARFAAQPTIDGALLPAQIVDVFDRGEQIKVPVLAGFNSGEVRSQRGLVPPVPADAAAYAAGAARRYGDLAPAFLRLYPASDMEESLIAATRDIVYGWAIERLVRHQAAAGAPSYLYRFDHCYDAARARKLCAFHASEIPFMFGSIGRADARAPNWPAATGDDDRRLARQMVDYWASFAARGIPSAVGAPGWRPYGDEEYFLDLGASPVLRRDPMPGMFEFREEIMRRQRQRDEQWFVNTGPVDRE